MKKSTFNLLAAIFLWLGSCGSAIAQDVTQSDQIMQGQQIIQADSTTTGKFEPVIVNTSSTSDVALLFPLSLASKAVTVQALDGSVLQTADSASLRSE